VSHRFLCTGRPLTTADYLERAVLDDSFPDDPQTMEDYGFSRCETWQQKSHLLGLYNGLLINIGHCVSSQELDQWRKNGKLTENIINKYMEIPERSRGGYFPWFLKNKHLLDNRYNPSKSELEWFNDSIREATNHLQPEDQGKHYVELQPCEKRDSFVFFALALHHVHPHPGDPNDLWYNFGFCTCADEHEEMMLGGLYSRLVGGNKYWVDYSKSLGENIYDGPSNLPKATFNEFWRAYKIRKLIQLMDQYGLRERRQQFKYLERFLAVRPVDHRPPVWRLCHFLAFEPMSVDLPEAVLIGAQCYGFSPELSACTKIDLMSFYRDLIRNGGPIELDQARSQGKLLEYAQRRLGKIEMDVAHVLRNLE
jgi:hypothetical protein